MQEEDEGLVLGSVSLFLSCSSINLRTSSSLLFACLPNAELITDWISLREGGELRRTSGATSAL
jgi:hypothetical protein